MPDGSAQHVSRRGFMASAPLLVATLVACSNALWNRTHFADAFVTDPDWTAYHPALDAVITAVIPFEQPGYPIRSPDMVRERLIRMFPLEAEQRFLGLQRTIVLFDQIDLFTIFSGPLLQEEARARDISHRGGDWKQIAAKIRDADQSAMERFLRAVDAPDTIHFTELSLPARRRYLDLWRDSASIVKRQFYGALRSLVMISTYSMDDTWPSIGYGGPLLSRGAPG